MKLSREAWRRAYRAIEASTKGDASILSEGREVISATCKASTEAEIEVEWETELFVLLRREIDNPALRCPEFENVTRACELALKEENAGDGAPTECGTGTNVGGGPIRDGDCGQGDT
jgi:hypothetical protein